MASELDRLRKAIEKRSAGKGRKVGSIVIPRGKTRAASEVSEVIPSGLDVLDHWVLGCGGWPVGRACEVFGGEAVGKTTLLLRAMGEVQRLGGTCAFIDAERSLDRRWAAIQGCDLDSVLVLEPGSLEEGWSGLEAVLRDLNPKKGPHLVGYDSVVAIGTNREMDGSFEDKHSPARALLINRACRKVGPLMGPARAAVVFVNQIRDKVGRFSGGQHAPGGHAIRHLATIRLKLGVVSKGQVKRGKIQVGTGVKAQSWKNRLAPPWREAEVRLLYETGWDNRWTTIDHAKEVEAIEPERRVGDSTYREALEALGWSDGADDPAPE